ncbi:MAG: hypothetical protein RLZZ502_898 [Pseudomonadota bacterium]|jgi:vacuolar-type H+-ATPase subunit I/STV1
MNQATTTANAQIAGADQSVDKIRDILFGAQVRSIDDRIRQLELSILEKLNTQLVELKTHTDDSVAAVREQLNKHEAYTRTAQNEAVSLITHNTAKQFEQTKEQMRQQFASAESHNKEEFAKIAKLLAQVEASSVPRAQLAQFLHTLGNQLVKPQ